MQVLTLLMLSTSFVIDMVNYIIIQLKGGQ